MTNAEIKELAGRVLGPKLGTHGLEHIEGRIDRDDPDDPALFVEAFMKVDSSFLDGKAVSVAHHALSEALLDAGEARFPYFLIRYADEDVTVAGMPRTE